MRSATQQHLKNVVSHIQQVTAEIRNDTNEVVRSGDHIEIIRHFDGLRQSTDLIKEARKALDEIVEHLSREDIPDVMRTNNIRSITVEGVGKVVVSHKWSASMLDKAVGIQWLKDHDQGGIVQETVNAQTLAAHAKALMESEGKELPNDIFKVGQMAYTSITKVK